MAVLDREPRREAELLYRRAVVLLATLVANPDPADRALDRMGPVDRSMVLPTEASFRVSYDRLVAAGLPCRPFDDAWAGVQALRELYVPHLEVLARVFLVPPVFRTHAPPIPTLPAPRTGLTDHASIGASVPDTSSTWRATRSSGIPATLAQR